MPPLLECRDIDKSFGSTRALRGVSIALDAHEIRGLIGENGAGKSTLTRIIAGVHRPDRGQLLLGGRARTFASPQDALAAGIVTVHQDVNLIESMTVAENVFLNCEPRRPGWGWIDAPRMARESAELLATFEIDARADDVVAELPADTKKMVQLARAFRQSPRVLLLDEPTSALTHTQAELVRRQVARVAERGVAVLYISHHLSEVLATCGTITVVRDGTVVWSGAAADTDIDGAIRHMLGRELGACLRIHGQAPYADPTHPQHTPPASPAPLAVPPKAGGVAPPAARRDQPPALDVAGWTVADRVTDVSLTLRRGELLGIGGLTGAGLSELGRSLFGDERYRPRRGTLRLDGRAAAIDSPRAAIAHGLALVTQDRLRTGLLPAFSVADNMALPRLGQFTTRLGLLDRAALDASARRYLGALGIRAAGPGAAISTLSGGNQQKVMLAKWLGDCLGKTEQSPYADGQPALPPLPPSAGPRAGEPRVLIIDEPTIGVDVGAKQQIKAAIRACLDQGVAVLMLTTELDDIVELADRAVIMARGAVVARFDEPGFTKTQLLKAAADTPAGAHVRKTDCHG